MTGDVVAEAPAARPRLVWMDTLRGIAVFLVIYAHGVELNSFGAPRALTAIDRALAPFRVPALMFLSGMLLSASLAKPWPVYLRGKVSRIAWPYLVWSCLIIALSSFGEAGPAPLVELFVDPTYPTWYVGYLFVFYVLVMFTTPVVRTAIMIPVLAAAVLFDEVQGLVQRDVITHEHALRFFFTFFCFLAGDLLARHQARWLPVLTRRPVTVLCLALAIPAAVLSTYKYAVRYQPMFVPSVFGAIIGLIPGLTWLSGTPVGRFFAAQGRRSIVFYLVHYPAQVVTWHAVVFLGVRSGTVVVLGNLVAGVSAGFLMSWLRNRFPVVDYLFDLHLERFAGRGRRSGKGRRAEPVSGSSPAPAAEA